MDREDRATSSGGDGAAPAEALRGAAPGRRSGQRIARAAAAALAVLAVAVGLLLFLRVPPPGGQAQDGLALFRGWGKPDVALVLSGQQYGYLQKCGCSDPQFGGLVRRYNFLQTLKARGWPVVAVDLGDIADEPKQWSPQTPLKYLYSMKALKLMDYTAVSFGKNEIKFLDEALSGFALNNPSPRVVVSNLLDREKKGDRFHETVVSWELGGKEGAPKVGVLGIISPSVEKEGKDPGLKFHRSTAKVLEKCLGELRAMKAELIVLLYQGTAKEAKACAHFCADRRKANPDLPAIHVVLCLSEEEEPSGITEQVGEATIVSVGHRGRYVGVMGAFRTGKAGRPWEVRYQLVKMAPEYDTPEGKEKDHPGMAMMEDYAEDVKFGDYLEKLRKFRLKKHPVQVAFQKAEYVGSQECRGCHLSEYKIWAESRPPSHVHAYDALVKARHPKNRQFDGECVTCHVTGFAYETGFVSEAKTDFLKNVGCESCHGPCSEHIANTKNLEVRKAINPYRMPDNETPQARQYRMNQIDIFCQKCHDIDNDVHWQFNQRWPRIVHRLPRRAEAPPAVKGSK